MTALRPVLLVTAMVSLTACGRLGLSEAAPAYEPLPAQPSRPVMSEGLQPLPPQGGQPMQSGYPGQSYPAQGYPVQGGQPYPGDGQAVAAAPPPPPVSADKALPISRGAMSGGWLLAGGGESCQLFLTQTAWAGGSRANTKGCTSPELQRVSSWVIDGKQVVLKGTDGAMVGSLYAVAPEQFSGQTVSRQPISLSR